MSNKYEIALEEIKNNFRLQCEGVDKCKESARATLNANGLIIALISLLGKGEDGVLFFDLKNMTTIFGIISLLLFGLQVLAYVIAINPIKMEAPVNSTNDSFKEIFFNSDDEKAIKMLITRYQETIELNRDAVNRTSCLAKITNWLGAFSIIFAVIASIIGGFYG